MTPTAKLKEMCRPFWDEITARDPVARLWKRDHTLWKPDPEEISNRLGWLDLPKSMSGAATELDAFAQDVKGASFKDVVLLGMGGSSLCAEVLRRGFGKQEGFPKLTVLDSTVPACVKRVERAIRPAQTLFLVASKSGSTIEVLSFYKYFRRLVEGAKGDDAGENFVAITDRGSGLERIASEDRFRRVFINPSDVGGRYSALSYFGLVPAAAAGLNAAELLLRGKEATRLCEVRSPLEENPGAWLGLVLGCLARNGRDKLTVVTSPRLASFALWAEQLVAESTGKEGRGIVPIAMEPFAPAEAYGEDRVFVYLRLAGDDNDESDRHVRRLDQAGLPVIMKSDINDLYDLGAEFFRWEFAIALAGACLGINPFDQPNVQESKDNTKRILSEYGQKKALPEIHSEGTLDELLRSARRGDYLALMAFAEDTPELEEAVASLRKSLLTKHRLPTTFGYGPRFLHSTGQLHKGGADNVLAVQITTEPEPDLPIPGEPYSFGTLMSAQAIGDFEALRSHRRRVMRVHLSKDENPAARIRALLP